MTHARQSAHTLPTPASAMSSYEELEIIVRERQRAQLKKEQFARNRGGPRGGGARASTGSGTTSRSNRSERRTMMGLGGGTAGTEPSMPAAFSREAAAAVPEASRTRSQQSGACTLAPQVSCVEADVGVDGQQHLSTTRPMPWQKR